MAQQCNAMTTDAAGEPSNVTEAELVACVPHLRIFAMSLTRSRDYSEDLVQDTIVRALTASHQFRAGSNLKAWMFTILRNLHYDAFRKKRIQTHALDDTPGQEPAVLPSQDISLEFGDVHHALWQLEDNQRKALILVGADGLTYEEAAKLCDCPTGTIKSRVSRARRHLLDALEHGSPSNDRRDHSIFAGYLGDPPVSVRTRSSATAA
jgi:RNA polymerase sigma-70 factor, ECF subfamily